MLGLVQRNNHKLTLLMTKREEIIIISQIYSTEEHGKRRRDHKDLNLKWEMDQTF
jgi:hypothetical protein